MAARPKLKTGIARIVDHSAQPIYVVNSKRQIVFCNAALGRWLSFDEKQLLGVACHYHSRPDAEPWDSVAAALCPPGESWSGSVQRFAINLPSALPTIASGTETTSRRSVPSRNALGIPILDNNQRLAVIVFVESDVAPLDLSALAVASSAFGLPAQLHQQLIELRRQCASIYRLERILGVSPEIQWVRRRVAAAIASGANTTIVASSPGSAEQIARTIHYSQFPPGQSLALIPVDCAVCDAETIQSSLRHLNSERVAGKPGRLLLLGADRLRADAMHELLAFVRLPTFDIGVLATASESLIERSRREAFEPHLALQLATVEIQLPPLRDRSADIPLLAQAIVEDFNAEGNQQLSGLCPRRWNSCASTNGRVIWMNFIVWFISRPKRPKEVKSASPTCRRS